MLLTRQLAYEVLAALLWNMFTITHLTKIFEEQYNVTGNCKSSLITWARPTVSSLAALASVQAYMGALCLGGCVRVCSIVFFDVYLSTH